MPRDPFAALGFVPDAPEVTADDPFSALGFVPDGTRSMRDTVTGRDPAAADLRASDETGTAYRPERSPGVGAFVPIPNRATRTEDIALSSDLVRPKASPMRSPSILPSPALPTFAARAEIPPPGEPVDETPYQNTSRWQDAGTTMSAGLAGMASGLVGLTDIASAGASFVTKTDVPQLGQQLRAMGLHPDQFGADVAEEYSPATQMARQRFDEASGIMEKAGVLVTHPSLVLTAVAESIPSIVGGGMLGKSIAGASALAAGVGEGALSGGGIASAIGAASPDGRLTPEQAGLAAGAGFIVGAIGTYSSTLATRLGLEDADQVLIGVATRPVERRSFAQGVKQVLAGAVQEGLIEEVPQSDVETMVTNVGTGRPLFEGVADATLMGFVTGGAMGGGLNGATYAAGMLTSRTPKTTRVAEQILRAEQTARFEAANAAYRAQFTPEAQRAALEAQARPGMTPEQVKAAFDQMRGIVPDTTPEVNTGTNSLQVDAPIGQATDQPIGQTENMSDSAAAQEISETSAAAPVLTADPAPMPVETDTASLDALGFVPDEAVPVSDIQPGRSETTTGPIAAPVTPAVYAPSFEQSDVADEIRRFLNLNGDEIDAYDPAASVHKSGRTWTYDLIGSKSLNQASYKTRTEAVAAAEAHKALKADQYAHPTTYYDVTSLRATDRMRRAEVYATQGLSEMDAYRRIDAEDAATRTQTAPVASTPTTPASTPRRTPIGDPLASLTEQDRAADAPASTPAKWPTILGYARANGYKGTQEALHRAWTDIHGFDAAQRGDEESGDDGKALLRAIRDAGGIANDGSGEVGTLWEASPGLIVAGKTKDGGRFKKVRKMPRGALLGVSGVLRNDGTGLTWDGLREALSQVPAFRRLADASATDLMDEVLNYVARQSASPDDAATGVNYRKAGWWRDVVNDEGRSAIEQEASDFLGTMSSEAKRELYDAFLEADANGEDIDGVTRQMFRQLEQEYANADDAAAGVRPDGRATEREPRGTGTAAVDTAPLREQEAALPGLERVRSQALGAVDSKIARVSAQAPEDGFTLSSDRADGRILTDREQLEDAGQASMFNAPEADTSASDRAAATSITTKVIEKVFGYKPDVAKAAMALIKAMQLDTDPRGMALAEKGATIGEGASFQQSSRPSPFYSRLIRAVEASSLTKASGAQWKATIRNAKTGINADEFALVGVADLFDPTTYTKEEILDYLSAHQVTVEDVTLGGGTETAIVSAERASNEARNALSTYLVDNADFTERGAAEYARDAAQNDLSEPQKRAMNATQRNLVMAVRRAQVALMEWRSQGGNAQTQFGKYQEPGADPDSYREVFLTAPSIKATWNDGHAAYRPITNPIVRLRFNTRTTADGSRVLFLEEVQPPSKGNQGKMPALLTKHWREIAFKWAVRHATVSGLDGVAWTPGKVQADRYDLSKQINRVQLVDAGGGALYVSAWATDKSPRRPGGLVMDSVRTTADDLPEIIGKDVAQKLLDAKPDAGGSRELSGVDLKVGGEGLTRLYDVDFKNVANAIPAVKKAGVKVEQAMLPNVGNSPILRITPAIRDAVMAGQPLFQPAYHGSPHIFDKFSLHKIGTGEGTQAFGHGLYFAQRRELADYYRRVTSQGDGDTPRTFMLDGKMVDARRPSNDMTALERAAYTYIDSGRNQSIAIAETKKALDVVTPGSAAHAQYAADLAVLESEDFAGRIAENRGRTYKVEIPDDEEMLDLDKPLTEQPKKVKDALKASGVWKAYNENLSDYSSPMATRGITKRGDTVYAFLAHREGSEKAASEYLAQIGIPGLRFLDRASRAAGRGTHNYVIFDDKLVTIMEYDQGARAAVEFAASGKALIHALEHPDASSLPHELAHIAHRWLLSRDVPPELRRGIEDADIADVEQFLGVPAGTQWDQISVEQKEKFARAFERYLREGIAPTPTLAKVFQAFAEWLSEIYQTLVGSDIDVELTPEIRRVFDRLLTRAERNAGADLNRQAQAARDARDAKKRAGFPSTAAVNDGAALSKPMGKRGTATAPTSIAAAPSSILPVATGAPPRASVALSPSKILADLRTAFQQGDTGRLPVSVGGFAQRAWGIFKPKARSIRLKVANDIDTALHEFGHDLDVTIAKVALARYDGELRPLGQPTSAASYTADQVRKEGAAEWFRVFMLDPDSARRLAPFFTQATLATMSPKLREQVTDLQRRLMEYQNLTPGQQGALKVSFAKASWGEDSFWKRAFLDPEWGRLRLKTDWINVFAPIEAVEADVEQMSGKTLGPESRASVAAQQAVNAMRVAEGMLFDGVRDLDGVFVAPSLSAAVAPVKDRLEDFATWLVMHRAIELHDLPEPRNPGITREQAQDYLDQTERDPRIEDFREAQRRVEAFQDAVVSYVIAKHGLPDVWLDEMRAIHKAYVPLQRVFEEMDGEGRDTSRKLADRMAPIFRLKGSGRDIVNPLESIIHNTIALTDFAEKNAALLKLTTLVGQKGKEAPQSAKWMERIQKRSGVGVQVSDFADAVKGQAGQDAAQDVLDILEEHGLKGGNVLTYFRANFRPNKATREITVLNKGQLEVWQVHSPMLFESLEGMGPVVTHDLVSAFQFAVNVMRAGVTLRPSFFRRNFVIDQFTALAQSRHGYAPVYDGLRGMYAYVSEKLHEQGIGAGDEDARQFLSSAVVFSTLAGSTRTRKFAQRTLDELTASGDIKALGKYFIKHPLHLLRAVGEVAEFGTRLAEFKLYRESGGVERRGGVLGLAQRVAGKVGAPGAAWTTATPFSGWNESRLIGATAAASDVTVNFFRGGRYAKQASKFIPFFNPMVQGYARIGETIARDPAGAALTVGMFALVSMALWGLQHQDDDEREANGQPTFTDRVEAWERALYWHIPTRTGYARIAKPREWAGFANVTEALLDYTKRENPQQLNAYLPNGLMTNGGRLAWFLVPQLLAPMLEVSANYDSFRDRPIENPWDRRPAGQRFNEWTSETAKLLGRVFDVSPAKIDHLIYGYAPLAGDANRKLDAPIRFLKGEAGRPPQPSRGWREPEFRSLDPTTRGDAMQQFATLAADPAWDLGSFKGKKVETWMRDLFDEADGVYASTTLTPDEKRTRLIDIRSRMIVMAKRGLVQAAPAKPKTPKTP